MKTRHRILEAGTSGLGLVLFPTIIPDSGAAFAVGPGEDFIIRALQTVSSYGKVPEAVRDYVVQNPEEAADSLMDEFGMVIAVNLDNDISVYSSSMQQKLPRAFVAEAQSSLGITKRTPVAWYSSVEGSPTMTTAGTVFWGTRQVVDKPRASARPATGAIPPREKSEMRKKFWGPGGFDPETAEDIVNKLLQ